MGCSAVLDLLGSVGVSRTEGLRAMHSDLAVLENVNGYDATLRAAASIERAGVGQYTFCLPDVLIDRAGRVRFTEVNTSNAAITFPHLADGPRVAHMCDTLFGRRRPTGDGAVVLVPRSPDTTLGPEIKLRAIHMAAHLEDAGVEAHVRDASDDHLPGSGLTVVSGTIPQIVPLLAREGPTLRFRGREVSFFNNQNLIAALARHEGSDLSLLLAELDPDVIHEGTSMAVIGLDKGIQQRLAQGTGIEPVASRQGAGAAETVEIALEMAQEFGGSVVKPDAASGGTAVIMVDPLHRRDEVEAMVQGAAGTLAAKYGEGWERTCTMRVYEFVDAVPARRRDGAAFRWDLRVEVLARPDTTTITPIIARTCPEPIGRRISAASAMTNLTGRARGANERLSPAELLRRTGVDPSVFDELADGVRRWLDHALASAAVS